eukprot:bmy_11489T0
MSPLPVGWGWEAPRGPGGEGRDSRAQSLFTWLPALGPAPELPPSLSPAFSCRPSTHCPLHPHCHLPPPDLLHLSSPAGPQWPPPSPSSLPPSPQPTPPSSGSLSFLTSASQPHVLPIPTLPDPWVSLRSPSLRQRQAGVGTGLGPSPTAAPLPSPFCII